jgi:Zn-dependent M28 family amino/carboxypeptidase
VVGIFEGADDSMKEECVVIGAHLDHIGMGHFASRGKRGQVHNGANDNASGTAGVLALARVFTHIGIEPRRTVVFVAFDGEEKGLLGSKHYVKSPSIPLDKTVAMLNMDMIGRGPIKKIKVGGGTLNKTLNGILSRISARFGMGLDLKGLDAFLRNSDQAPFMDRKIPCIFLSSGLYSGLHSEKDDPELLNSKKMEAIVRTMMLVAVEVANMKKRP